MCGVVLCSTVPNQSKPKTEREDYQNEGLDLEAVAFADNIVCLELIESSASSVLRRGAPAPPGILQLLDEEVNLPKGNDVHLMERLVQSFDVASTLVPGNSNAGVATRTRAGIAAAEAAASSAADANTNANTSNTNAAFVPVVAPAPGSNPYFSRVLKRPNCFVVKHFCGSTEYAIDGFVSKNRDKLADSLRALLYGSKCAVIRQWFDPSENLGVGGAGGDSGSGGGAASGGLEYLLREEKRRQAAKTNANATIAYQVGW
jgi:myosin heavy subunit